MKYISCIFWPKINEREFIHEPVIELISLIAPQVLEQLT